MCVEHRMWFKIADKTDIATVAICMVSTVLKWRIKLFCLGSCNSMGWRKYSGSNVYLWCAKNTLLWLQSYIPHLTNQPDKNKASEGFLFWHDTDLAFVELLYRSFLFVLGGWVMQGEMGCWLGHTRRKILWPWPSDSLLDLHNLLVYGYCFFRKLCRLFRMPTVRSVTGSLTKDQEVWWNIQTPSPLPSAVSS